MTGSNDNVKLLYHTVVLVHSNNMTHVNPYLDISCGYAGVSFRYGSYFPSGIKHSTEKFDKRLF